MGHQVWNRTRHRLGALAGAAGKNHLDNVIKVFESEDTHWEGVEQFRQYFHLVDLQFDDKHTLWENYAPDVIEPGNHSKPGYVGWTGVPPIAVITCPTGPSGW